MQNITRQNNLMQVINNFVKINNLLPADALIVKKEPLKLLDHYIIYLGNLDGQHLFMANYTKGTRILTNTELVEFSQEFTPKRILRFQGNDMQRDVAVRRALSRKDQSSYHLILNNCQHFSTYVQSGKHQSGQTQAFGTSLVFTGLITAASSKKQETQVIGFFAAALGLITLLMEEK